MKSIFITLLLTVLTICVYSQQMPQEEFDIKYEELINELMAENYSAAYTNASSIYSRIENDSAYDHEQKVIRYILIYSTAGMMNNEQLTKEEALEKVIHLKGTYMIMPAHTFNENCYTNCIHISEDTNTFFSGVNNSDGTNILSFEYVTIADGIKHTIEEMTNKMIILEGTLDEITTEGFMFPHFSLKFSNGKYTILD